ncbi:unnamed protein product [Ilex paraguariensis]|uniref:ABC transporter domain-containing protein n=1 Tax=Ilex paraguariensis TaxID=185542 RepID=A0ABC8T6Q2_9AQUA
MAQLVGADDIESPIMELSEIRRSIRSSFRRHTSSSRSISGLSSTQNDHEVDDEHLSQWAAVERLPTLERLRSSLFDENEGGKRVVDVTKLDPVERHMFIDKLIKHIENDNLRLLQKFRKRLDKVGVKLPTVEDCAKLLSLKSQETKISILNDASGIIKPGRMTLLLGPPGCGKTTLLKALSGNLSKSLEVTGDISYNGYKLEEFVPQKTSAYISQNDLHIPEMTVRETLDFSAHCQGVRSRADIMTEVSRREKEARIVPDPDLDTYMKGRVKGN